MHDRTDTLEPDSQACATVATVEGGGGDGGRELGNRTGVQLWARREPHRLSELGLRFRQNEALPIHSLPTELFLQVIHHHMRPYFKDVGFEYYRRLISLTGVCSRWCNIIRDSPSLWNRIHWSDSPEVVKIALRRSSNHPLDHVLHTGRVEQEQGFMSWLMTALDAHRYRWRSMDISVSNSETGDVITALSEPAPSLERLSLADEDNMSSTEEFDFFRGSAPRLTDLTLDGVSIRWDSEVIYDLTVLDLSWIRFPSTNTILNILSHSPRLQVLAIYESTTESMANPSSARIQLSHLTSLRVSLGDLSATEDLLGHIEASEQCSLATFLQEDEKIEEFLLRRLLKWMSKWKNSALVPFEGLLLEIGGDVLRVELSTTDRSEPLALAIEGSPTSWATQFRLAVPYLIDTLASWTKGATTLRLRLRYLPSGCHNLSFKQSMIEQVLRLPPITSLELSGVNQNSFLHGLELGDVSPLVRNIRTLSLRPSAWELRECWKWVCEAVQIVKDAAKSSSNDLNHSEHVLQLELHLSEWVASTSVMLVEVAVEDLERLAGSGNVLLIVEDD